MLLHRSFLAQARDVAALKTAIFKSVFVGVIIGIVFYDKANPSPPYFTVDALSGESLLTTGVQNLASAFFFFLMYCLMNNLEQIPAICLNQNLYRRELASYSYSAAPYWLVNCIYPLPLALLTHTIWFVMSFYMCDFTHKFEYLYIASFLLSKKQSKVSRTFVFIPLLSRRMSEEASISRSLYLCASTN